MPRRDFTKPREPITFTIGDDEFEAFEAIPAEVLAEFGARFGDTDLAKQDAEKQLSVYRDVLEMALEPVSFQRFCARLSDRKRPIDLVQLDEVVTWLFECYGMRPTPPSEPSSDGSSPPPSGIPSTESTPAVA